MGPNGKHGLSRRALLAASALDVSVQAGILGTLEKVRERRGLTMPFIIRDVRAAVLRRGEIVEQGRTATVFAHPQHEYARALLNRVPGRHWTPPVLSQDTPQCPRSGA